GLLILAVCMAVAARAFPQANGMQQAMVLFQQQRWAECATAFEKVEKDQPGATDALLYEGKCLINLGQFKDADTALQAYIAAHPHSEDGAYLIAYVRFREDKPRESLSLYTSAGKIKPPTADDLKIVALDYVLLNDFSDAGRYLDIALKLEPDNLEARYHLGRVRYEQNRFDEAMAAFQEVLKHDPNSVKAEDNLGLSFEAKNETDEAIAAYRKAIEFDASARVHTEQPYLDLGTLLIKLNQAKNAVPVLSHAKEINPKSSKVHYQLGKAYFDMSLLPDAKTAAENAASLNPDDIPTHYLLGKIYQRLGKPDLAAQQFKLTETLTRSQEMKSGSMGMALGTETK
ncbi:MAG TPA: tetratricopeptide repeat protein, partial [Terriglobales bacterium]|nr:tetratricopeptide repeat protein [Terriglobales bacterium]